MAIRKRSFNTKQKLWQFQFKLAEKGVFESLTSKKGKRYEILY
jgi:hypothetical protein